MEGLCPVLNCLQVFVEGGEEVQIDNLNVDAGGFAFFGVLGVSDET